ncbi:MAG: glycosyltransferase family 39 protein [Anaerolineales bacterium]|nr:glycosyltransferase family 39 protein [Anaerolineales bacterium]
MTTGLRKSPVGVFLLVAGIVFSIGIRLWLLPMRGHVFDINQFKTWALAAETHGLLAIYSTSSANYPPLALIPLALAGKVYRSISPDFDLSADSLTVLIKLPPIFADLLAASVIYDLVKRRFNQRTALVCAVIHALNPAIWYTSAWWGQVESFYALPMLLAVVAMEKKRPASAWAWFAVGLLFKPQAAAIAPVLAVASWIHGKWRDLLKGAAAAASVLVAMLLPWALAGQLDELIRNVSASIGNKLFLTMNAHNLWYLVSGGKGSFAFRENNPLLDTQPLLGPLTGRQVGLVLIGVWTLVVCWSLLRSNPQRTGAAQTETTRKSGTENLNTHVISSKTKTRRYCSKRDEQSDTGYLNFNVISHCVRNDTCKEYKLYLASAAMVVGFFMLPTESHERYLYPVFLLMAPLLPALKPLRWLYFVLSLTYTLNVLWVDSAIRLPAFSENLMWGMPVSAVNLILLVFTAANLVIYVRDNVQKALN